MTLPSVLNWQTICSLEEIIPETGVCAKVGNQQIAVFRTRHNKVYALNNYDPFSQSNVIYRGILGSINNNPVVASPVFKQHFSLENGRCLQDESISLNCYPVKIENNQVLLGVNQ